MYEIHLVDNDPRPILVVRDDDDLKLRLRVCTDFRDGKPVYELKSFEEYSFDTIGIATRPGFGR